MELGALAFYRSGAVCGKMGLIFFCISGVLWDTFEALLVGLWGAFGIFFRDSLATWHFAAARRCAAKWVWSFVRISGALWESFEIFWWALGAAMGSLWRLFVEQWCCQKAPMGPRGAGE